MNRPLKRKLSLALLAYIDANKAGTPFADITLVSGASTTIAQEAAFDAGGDMGEITEPLPPYLAVDAVTVADPELPGVASFEVVLHLKTLATVEDEEGEPSTRADADAILRAVYDLVMTPPNDAAAFSDSNLECGALLTYANKPAGTDLRPTYRKPLHIYRMWHTTSPTLYDADTWHDQLVFAGHAQDMGSS